MLVASAFLLLTETMAAPVAAAVTGGGLLVTAGLMALVAMFLRRARSRRQNCGAETRKSTTGSASCVADLLDAAEAAIDRDARSEIPLLALMALLAGCAIGTSPELRRAIGRIIR
jgi:hypothetical protein